MRAFNRTNNSSTSSTSSYSKSKSACSYCGDVEHQVTKCPHVKSDWAMFQSFTMPCSDPDNWTNNPKAKANGQRWNNQANNARWFKDPSGWSKWYAQCEKAYGKMIKAEERANRKAQAKSKGKRAKTCGFCGGIGHNRRDCPEMQALNKRLIKANNHWRQRLYDTFVSQMGIGNGALIQINQPQGWQKPAKSGVGIITSVNWDELNMFCYTEESKRGWRHKHSKAHENIGAPLEIKVVVNGEEKILTWKSRTTNQQSVTVINDTNGQPLVDQFPYGWSQPEFIGVTSPTETPLSVEWLTQGQSECVEFMTKKYSLAKLTEWQAISLLENYESRFNL